MEDKIIGYMICDFDGNIIKVTNKTHDGVRKLFKIHSL